MGAPIADLSAAGRFKRLPVVAALEPVAAQLDLIDLAENTRIDDIRDHLKAVFKAAVVTDVQMRACGLAAQLDQLLGFCGIHRERLFKEDILACKQCHFSMLHVVDGAGCNVDEFDFGVSNQLLNGSVSLGIELLGKGSNTFGNDVTASDENKFILAGCKLVGVHGIAGAAKANNTYFDGVAHFTFLHIMDLFSFPL
jgi:hypothetical protein